MVYTCYSNPIDAENFSVAAGKEVGYLMNLEIDGEALTPDFNLRDPENPSNFLKVCGVLTFLEWDLLIGTILRLEGRLPDKNQPIFKQKACAHDTKAHVSFDLNWYKKGPGPKGVFYKSFSTEGTPFEAKLCVNDRPRVEDKKAEGQLEFTQAETYGFSLPLVGSDEPDEQKFAVNFGLDRKESKIWSKKVG